MPAKVEVHTFHGSITGGVNTSTLRFKRADDDVADLAAPLRIPAGGTTYSWVKSMKLYVKEGLQGTISNLRFWAAPEPDDWTNQVSLFLVGGTTYTTASATDELTPIGGTDVNDYTNETPFNCQQQPYRTMGLPIWSVKTDVDPTQGIPASRGQTGIGGNGTWGVGQFLLKLQLAVKPGCTDEIKSDRLLVYRYDEM